jgi:hypothetical protein
MFYGGNVIENTIHICTSYNGGMSIVVNGYVRLSLSGGLRRRYDVE